MPIFKIDKIKASQITLKENGFGREEELRDFFAENLDEILGVRFIEKEYPINYGGIDYRIDTLGIDENNTPVIIEYKWKENEEIFSQGKCYFNWLVKNKPHFELLVDKKLGVKTKVNWEQPRVILIAQGFSRYVLGAVQQEKNIELKTYTYYEPDILQIENIYSPAEIKTSKKNGEKREAREYNLEYHLNITSPEMQKIANSLRLKILELPDVKENFGKSGIFYRTTKSFARLEFRPTWIQLLIREPYYKSDVKKLVKDVTSNEWGYRGKIKFTLDSDVDYIFNLIKESYESTL
ncbi:MAG: hypothetical protein KY055_00870 [Candidatus Nealsonbacteria bacterium]|nr:hypothetical protein [Candidatus Nealsonbacteria bacterium]